MAAVSMSKQEFGRLEVLLGVQSGRLRVADACALIGLRRRQVFRLLRGVKQNGAVHLLSRHRGKPSNHRLPAEVHAQTEGIEVCADGASRRAFGAQTPLVYIQRPYQQGFCGGSIVQIT